MEIHLRLVVAIGARGAAGEAESEERGEAAGGGENASNERAAERHDGGPPWRMIRSGVRNLASEPRRPQEARFVATAGGRPAAGSSLCARTQLAGELPHPAARAAAWGLEIRTSKRAGRRVRV